MTTKGKIASAAAIIFIAAALSKVFGFILNMIIAAKFGTSGQTDAFLVSMTIPDLLRDMLTGGALTAAFIPVFSSYLAQGKNEEAQKISSGIINMLLIGLIFVSLIGVFLAPYLVKFIAPGFSGETYNLTVTLTRILFPVIIFFGMTSILGAILNSYQYFTAPAFTPLILNFCVITAAFIFCPIWGIFGLTIGVIIGGLAQLLIQVPALIQKGVRYSWNFDFNDPGIKKIGFLLGPIIIGLSVNQINIVVNRILASTLSSGSIAALTFADRLNQTPVTVFGIALSTAIFPSLSWQAAREDMEKFKTTVSLAIRMILLFTFPVTVTFMMLKLPIIRLLFQRGEFNIVSTQATAVALFYYSIGIFALATNYVIIKAYYALQDTKTPVRIGIGAIILNILLNFILIRFLGHGGLALATSIAAILQMIILFVILTGMVKGLDVGEIGVSFVKIVLSSIFSGWAGYLVSGKLESIFPPINTLNQAIQLSGAFLVVLVFYVFLIHLSRMTEGKIILETIKIKLKGND
jgi:putative peptidoglycan lipid II flippase